MKLFLSLLAYAFIAGGCGNNSGETVMRSDPPDPSEAPRRQRTEQEVVVDGNTAFALDLYGKLQQKPGNLILSPSSISLALGMTYAGARGQTERQMASVLHFELSQERLHPALGNLAHALASGGSAEPRLTIANRLWGRKAFAFREAFLSVTRERYGAELAQTVFPEPGRSEINNWTAEQTANKVQELIKEGVLDQGTALVLVSAIYFKGQWAHPFLEAETQPADFYVTPEEMVKVPMMHKDYAILGYGEAEDVQVLELPYKAGAAGGEYSMLIFLPKKRDGLAKLEESLKPERLRRLVAMTKQHSGKLHVYLPRFSFTSAFSLLPTLSELGLTNASDFRGMSEKGGLSLSAVVHGGFIRVDEKGTEAAAATAVMVAQSLVVDPPVFRADHPFLFLIQHKATRSIIFLGRVVRP